MIFEAILIGSGVLAFSALVITSRILKAKRAARCMEKFSEYHGILEYFMDKAFQIIYKDRVMTYSLDATKPRESEIDVISKDFVRLTQKFLGPMMQSELTFMYGGEEAFVANVLDYFNTHFEDDEIRNSALANLQEAEEG